MKSSTIVLSGVAVFAGVLGALQVHDVLQKQAPKGDLLPINAPAAKIVTAGFDSAAPQVAPFDFRAAAKAVNASVVSVDRYEQVRRGFGWGDDSAPATLSETGQGSGVIVATDGTIVTNNHVVANDRGGTVDEVKVRLADNRTYTAKVLGHDPRSDLAVLKIQAPNLTPIAMGNSTDVEVGEWVLAAGNPLGFSNTVSVGVVSSLKRNVPVGAGMIDAIQTDAAINPGNSGGALCDSQGRLIGINAAIASSTGQSVGIGFAIPVDRVKAVVNDIVKYGYARYAGLGVQYNARLEGALADAENRAAFANQLSVDAAKVPNHGIIVMQTGGAAQSAGIQNNDVLLNIDGHNIEQSIDLNQALTPKKPGDKVEVRYWSKGQTKTATVTLQALPRPESPV